MSKAKIILKILIGLPICLGIIFGFLWLVGLRPTDNVAFDIGRYIGIAIGIYIFLVFIPSQIFKDKTKDKNNINTKKLEE